MPTRTTLLLIFARKFRRQKQILHGLCALIIGLPFSVVLAQSHDEQNVSQSNSPSEFSLSGKSPFTNSPFSISNTNVSNKCKGVDLEMAFKRWNAFRHRPFETGGFNPLVLPFEFSGTQDGGKGKEALAFSFLLSNALDWTPGNYCSRHAYFIFKRATDEVQSAARTHDAAEIAAQMGRWHATHALAGKLVCAKNGYSGELRVFDWRGKEVLNKTYGLPRDYFALLAAMCADVMRFVGYEPSPALIAYVGTKRCKDFQSIIDLGTAAFEDERSGDEFGLYRKILERDPEFAEVRYWAGNQSFWASDASTAIESQLPKVLGSYLMPMALGDYDLSAAGKSNPGAVAEFEKWVDEAEKLVGSNAPIVLSCRLKMALSTGTLGTNLWDRAVAAASIYPNDYRLIFPITSILSADDTMSPADNDLLVGLCVAILNSRYMFGASSGRRYMMDMIADATGLLGQHLLEFQLRSELYDSAMESGDADSVVWYSDRMAEALRRMGLLEDSYKVWSASYDTCVASKKFTKQELTETCIGACLLRREDLVQEVLKRHKNTQLYEGFDTLIAGYLDALHKVPLSAERVSAFYHFSYDSQWAFHEHFIPLAYMDCLHDSDACRRKTTQLLEIANPNDREMWMLFDAYDRRDPSDESWCFYEALDWLFKGDPGVDLAVAERRKRRPMVPGADKANEETVMKQLGRFKNSSRWPAGLVRCSPEDLSPTKIPPDILAMSFPPGSVAVVVRDLLKQGKKDTARELVLQYHAYATSIHAYNLRVYCNHLYHLVEQSP